MKISGSSGAGAAAGVAGARRPAGAGGFSPTAEAGGAGLAAASAPATGAGPVTGLEALLALQDVGGPLERRRRAIARGGRLLDDLDKIKLALLDGGDPAAVLGALRAGVAETRERGEEPALDDVLDQIDLRAAVELAKAEAPPPIRGRVADDRSQRARPGGVGNALNGGLRLL